MNLNETDQDTALIDFGAEVQSGQSNTGHISVKNSMSADSAVQNNAQDFVQLRNAEKQNSKEQDASKKNYSRLCGYLNKHASRGILKTVRRRWFVFSENNCKLYYYRSPQDFIPLGEIDISQASFYFDVTNKEKEGLFTISIPGRDYVLEAKNRQACLFWLQELQKFRRANSLRRTELVQESISSWAASVGNLQSGLLAKPSSSTDLKNDNGSESLLMIPVSFPDDVGDDCASREETKPFFTAQQKLNEFRSNIMNSMNSIRQTPSPCSEALPSPEKCASAPSVGSSVFFEDSSPDLLPDTEVTSPVPKVRPAKTAPFGSFRLRLSESFRRARLGNGNESPTNEKKFVPESSSKCKKIGEKAESLEEEVVSLRDELKASQDVISVLREQLEITLTEKDNVTTSSHGRDVLNTQDEQPIPSHTCQSENSEVEKSELQIVSLEKEIKKLQQNNEVLHELVQEKDRMIIELTNEVFDLESEKRDNESNRKSCSSCSSYEIIKPSDYVVDCEDVEKLQDAVQAFELQNKFLNKEILELNQLRRESERRGEILSLKCSNWEAKSYQIQSKLLYLLNILEKGIESKNHEAISRLLEEAMDENSLPKDLSFTSWSNDPLYDELGFNWRWGKENLISSKAANLKQRSEDMTSKAKDAELASWRTKWDNFVVALGSKELNRSPELKMLIRQGVPHEYRGKIWNGCINMRIKNYRLSLGPEHYASLLAADKIFSSLDPASKQIELDLLRTLPNNRHYETLDSVGIPKLRRVLLAYSVHDPSVGYCQGLNRLAAIALLFMDEEDAFWCLVGIIKSIMPGYFSRTLVAPQVDQRVLKDLVAEKLPRLHAHLEANNVDLSLFTFNWFLTIFVDNIPVETYLKIWDVFLYEGCKVLFRYALAFLKMCENQILQKKDYMAINRFLRNMGEEMTDIKKISLIAFNEMNPFPMKSIESKRAHHKQIVQALSLIHI